MDDNKEYIHFLGAYSEPFSRISYSGAAFYGDAVLGRVAAARIWQQKNLATQLLLSKLGAVIFSVDVEKDVLYYQRILADGNSHDRKVVGFSAALEKLRAGNETEGRKLAEALSRALTAEMEEEVRFRAALFSERLESLEAVFRSTAGANGKIESLAGYIMSSDAMDLLKWQGDAAKSARIGPGEMRELVNSALNKLQPGQKGVLFLIEITPVDNDSLEATRKAIKADFRNEDILAQLSPKRLALFIKGLLTEDIINRRAGRLAELCRGLNPKIGSAISESLATDFDVLVQKAGEGLA